MQRIPIGRIEFDSIGSALYLVPMVARIQWPTICIARSGWPDAFVFKGLRRMVRHAQRLNVCLVIGAALEQGHDVIELGCRPNAAFPFTHDAQRMRTKPAQSKPCTWPCGHSFRSCHGVVDVQCSRVASMRTVGSACRLRSFEKNCPTHNRPDSVKTNRQAQFTQGRAVCPEIAVHGNAGSALHLRA